MKKIIKFIVIYLITSIILISLLYLSSLIPKEKIDDNIKNAANELYVQTDKIKTNVGFKSILNHNSTDAIMLNTAFCINEKKPFFSMLNARRNYISNYSDKICLDYIGNIFTTDNKTYKFSMTSELNDTVNGIKLLSFNYARYWHGYLVVLRFLLIFMSFAKIKLLIESLIIICILTILINLLRKRKIGEFISLIITFICMYMYSWGDVLQGNLLVLSTMITSSLISFKVIRESNFKYAMLIHGMVTVFLDFFTIPILALFFPILIYLIFNEDIKIKEVIITIIFWATGYAAFWFSKWIIYDLFYLGDIISKSTSQMFFRIGTDDFRTSLLYRSRAIMKNISIIYNIVSFYVFYLSSIIIIIKAIVFKKKYIINLKNILYLLISIVPFAWYFIVYEHSDLHYFFTYKLLTISMFGLLLLATSGNSLLSLLKSKFKVSATKNCKS